MSFHRILNATNATSGAENAYPSGAPCLIPDVYFLFGFCFFSIIVCVVLLAKKNKKTNNDLQNITYKTKDRATRILLKTWGEPRFSGRVSSSCSISETRQGIHVSDKQFGEYLQDHRRTIHMVWTSSPDFLPVERKTKPNIHAVLERLTHFRKPIQDYRNHVRLTIPEGRNP
jgi:hypothetical protein